MAASSRAFDVILFGATGYTGKIAADYLARTAAPRGIKWAMAGRRVEAVQQVKTQLVDKYPAASAAGVIAADVQNQASLRQMAAQCTVVMSVVGPYTQFGEPLIQACLDAGTHYVDITGETPWVRRMIDTYDARAKSLGLLIVPLCGVDSVPSDLGTWLTVDHAARQFHTTVREVNTLVKASGGVSGGTIRSAIGMMNDSAALRAAGNPRLLCIGDQQQNAVSNRDSPKFLDYNHVVKKWTAPFIMAGVNGQVVRRSAGLAATAGRPYSDTPFVYTESHEMGSWFKALALSVGMGIVVVLLFLLPPLRRLVLRYAPEGPAVDKLDRGFMEWKCIGTLKEPANRRVIASIRAHGDPGYYLTPIMMVESALCIAKDRADLPLQPSQYGVVTPAFAFGNKLVDRLRLQGFEIKVVS